MLKLPLLISAVRVKITKTARELNTQENWDATSCSSENQLLCNTD